MTTKKQTTGESTASRNKSQTWFDVDRTGLRKLLADRGIEFAIFELIQNAWDESGVSHVDVTLKPDRDGMNAAELTVSDDAPNGFSDLRHAYTLFAESAKKGNPKQRGRFNIGEKLVLSQCVHASIRTTKGTVYFGSDGKRTEGPTSTTAGSIFSALIRLSKKDRNTIEREVQKLISPESITTTFNGVDLPKREIERTIDATLPTVLGDDHGDLRHSRRKTTINCYSLRDGEKAMIYEMGIPVVEHDCAFHCDVQQKVELTLDRTNVSERFLRALRLEVFNATHTLLSTEECNHEWAQTAIEHPDVMPEAVEDYMTKRFGEHRVSFDMSDPEANSRAVAAGYTVIKGGQMSGAMWQSVKTHEAIEPAGALFPTHSQNFVAFEPAQLTTDMQRVATYARRLAELLLDCSISVEFGEQASREAACWRDRLLQFNVRNLGKGWFNLKGNRLEIDDLIIHEFAHHYASNHLSDDYYHALSRLAAKAMQLGREGRLP
jgi:hypothetical protein